MSDKPSKAGAERQNLTPLDNILDTIGWTPLIRLNRVTDEARMPVFGKAEYLNPGCSVKDRIGLAMVEAAEASGELKPGGTVVEGTGGNTGASLALVAAIKGYRSIFTMPDKMSNEKVRLLKALGAEVVITPTAVTPDSPEHYINAAKRIAKETPGAFLANQFYNRVNTECHAETTGPEIWEQTQGKVRCVVAGAGTGGTASGIGRYLKSKDPSIRVVVADPVGSVYKQYHETGDVGPGGVYMVEGIGGDKIPDTMDFEYIDEVRTVTDRQSFTMARRLAREEGLFVGGSSGTVVHVATVLAREIDDPEGCVVTFLCDSGDRYLSKCHSDEWMRENRMLSTDRLSLQYLIDIKPGGLPSIVAGTPETSFREALALMSEHGISQLPVLEDGACVGAVSENRLMSLLLGDTSLMDAPVAEQLEAAYPVVNVRDSFEKAKTLLSQGHDAVLVRDAGELKGILTRGDILALLSS